MKHLACLQYLCRPLGVVGFAQVLLAIRLSVSACALIGRARSHYSILPHRTRHCRLRLEPKQTRSLVLYLSTRTGSRGNTNTNHHQHHRHRQAASWTDRQADDRTDRRRDRSWRKLYNVQHAPSSPVVCFTYSLSLSLSLVCPKLLVYLGLAELPVSLFLFGLPLRECIQLIRRQAD